jgi:hypothetical protein
MISRAGCPAAAAERGPGPGLVLACVTRLSTLSAGRVFDIGGMSRFGPGAAVAFDPLASYGIAAALGEGFYAAAAAVDHLAGRRDARSSTPG